MDSSNGAAVADDMCCPRKEVELPAKAQLPSKPMIAKRLARVLEAVAIKIEERRLAERHPFQPRPASYLAASDSRRDIDSYFDTLASTSPEARALQAQAAQKDLSTFFASLQQGTLDGLAPTVSQELPQPQTVHVDSELVKVAASQVADDLRASIKKVASRERETKFSHWKKRSQGV